MDVKEIEGFTIYSDNEVTHETTESWQEIIKFDQHPEWEHIEGCTQCATLEENFWNEYEDEIQFSIIALASALLLSLLITLGLYISYRCKNKEHPFKNAIRKAYLRWIVIFIVSAIIIYLWNFVDWIYYLFN